jgi:hypothetical protein
MTTKSQSSTMSLTPLRKTGISKNSVQLLSYIKLSSVGSTNLKLSSVVDSVVSLTMQSHWLISVSLPLSNPEMTANPFYGAQ